MSKTKKVLLGSMLGLAAVTLASCGNGTERNTTTPTYTGYKADQVVAKNGDKQLTSEFFYNRLRAKGYDLFQNSVKTALYNKEYTAVKSLLAQEYATASGDVKTALNWEDGAISEANYNKLKKDYTKTINNAIANEVFGTTSAKTVSAYTEKDLQVKLDKYADATARKGYKTVLTAADYALDLENDTISFFVGESKCKINDEYLNTQVLAQAEDLYSRKQLYKVATKEIVKDDDDEDVKNQYYIFEEVTDEFAQNHYESDLYENAYDTTFKTYGTYKAIIIQFNSRSEAELTINNLNKTYSLSDATAEAYYKALYETYYSYRDLSDEGLNKAFNYTITEDKNDFSEFSSSSSTISQLITDTLEDGDYLKEPRNIDNKYVMAFRISTEYQYPAGDTEKAYKDLTDSERANIIPSLQYNLLKQTASSYSSKALNEAIEESGLKIYDPYFEYKFNYSYSDSYEVIDKKEFKEGIIYDMTNGTSLTADDFYKEAKMVYTSSIVTDYFQLEYAHDYMVEYNSKNDESYKVEDDETYTNNETTLSNAITTFEKNQNTTYPSEIGLETYLLASFGYATKDDVLNYYYNYSSDLNSYKSQVLFDSWSALNNGDDKVEKLYVMSESATKLFQTLLNTGKDDYNTLFSMNVDHILINIDDDGDGSPDDPDKFLDKLDDANKQLFINAVQELAREIYNEVIYIKSQYEENSLIDIAKYVKAQYNKGAAITNPNRTFATWEEFKTSSSTRKTYNFLITVEALASSGDITQTSVSNFVKPFADYLKGLQSNAKEKYAEDFKSDKLEIEKGVFYVYDSANADNSGKITEATDATKINENTLCKTQYGYHLIILNSVSKPDYFTFDSSDDSTGAKKNVQLLINEKKTDTEDDNVLVFASAWNEKVDGVEPTAATVEQLFIYYVQSKNSSTTSFTDTVKSLLSSIYDDIITKFNSSTFNTYLLLETLDITTDDADITSAINAEIEYYKNSLTDYEKDSKYLAWTTAEALEIFKNARK